MFHKSPRVFKAQPPTELDRSEFETRFRQQFKDPRFKEAGDAVQKLLDIAWMNYNDHQKAPTTVKAGPGFKDPDYDLATEWLEARARIQKAQQDQLSAGKDRILVISSSPRNDHTCAGETPKSWRLAQTACEAVKAEGAEVDFLDLSELTAVYGRTIHPCKSCVSTARPLCHWPCSCYPNHSLGQSQDWMNEIYERWTRAHGILIVTPVHWYQTTSPLKLMIDRLVCADGGNPDPSSTHGKHPDEAKKIELDGWDYPKHLSGRSFGVVVHGDAAGVSEVRRSLSDWLQDMELVPAGREAIYDTYIGYYKPYATSHDELAKESAIFDEVRNVAIGVVRHVKMKRGGRTEPDDELKEPRQK